ncbi:Uncharacterised protein [Escherichia coli]|uniref:Uncharacterized protein n=1 Tax=Escherichia coli TaxID=562 RepID=A0A2X1L201_ECOLX|nr:Uncharacterised protein [Escherichia coli]
MQIVGKSCLWWMTLPLALKGLHQGEAGGVAHWFYFVGSFYSGGVRYVIAVFAVIILMSIYKPAK